MKIDFNITELEWLTEALLLLTSKRDRKRYPDTEDGFEERARSQDVWQLFHKVAEEMDAQRAKNNAYYRSTLPPVKEE